MQSTQSSFDHSNLPSPGPYLPSTLFPPPPISPPPQPLDITDNITTDVGSSLIDVATSTLQPHHKYPIATLLYMTIRHHYDSFDVGNTPAGVVALQAYGAWAHKLQTRVNTKLGMSETERKMVEKTALHGVDPLDVASGLIPHEALTQWKLDRKREQELQLRKAAELERALTRRSISNHKLASPDGSFHPSKSRSGISLKPTSPGAGKLNRLRSNSALNSPAIRDDISDTESIPLPDYAALPGDNYFPNEPERMPSVNLSGAVDDGQNSSDGEELEESERSHKSQIPELRITTSTSPTTSSHETISPAPPSPFVYEQPPPIVLNTDDVRHAVLALILVIATEEGRYDARARSALRHLARMLLLPKMDVERVEHHFAHCCGIVVYNGAADSDFNADKIARFRQDKSRRIGAMAAAAVGGGVILGLSAGLAAPLIGAGLGAVFTTVGLTGSTSFLTGTGGVALITTGATLTGSASAQSKMAKRMRGVSEFMFHPVSITHSMNLIITIGGWLAKTDEQATDLSLPFSVLDPGLGDHFSVIWESEMLRELGDVLKILAGEVLSSTVQQALMLTMLHTLVAGLAWPIALLKLGYAIDNPWQNALARARRAGQLLADLIVQQVQDARPVTLIGYSLGARVILYCLLELAENKAYGLIDDVYIFGCPATPSADQWRMSRSVVAGKFVNGYVSNDWILGFLFRASSVAWRVAGLAPANTPFIEDIDLTELVNGHMSYRVNMPRILKQVGFRVTRDDPEFLLNRDIEAEHRIDEQARIAKERDQLEKAAKKRSGKADVLSHLKAKSMKADSLSVMSRVQLETSEIMAAPGSSLPPTPAHTGHGTTPVHPYHGAVSAPATGSHVRGHSTSSSDLAFSNVSLSPPSLSVDLSFAALSMSPPTIPVDLGYSSTVSPPTMPMDLGFSNGSPTPSHSVDLSFSKISSSPPTMPVDQENPWSH